jgi:hypothetical protein
MKMYGVRPLANHTVVVDCSIRKGMFENKTPADRLLLNQVSCVGGGIGCCCHNFSQDDTDQAVSVSNVVTRHEQYGT